MTFHFGRKIFPAPEVTVVMPLFNAARSVDATINSVRAQSFGQFELVIIDDGSTDDSLARAMVHAAADDRIRLVSRLNGGVSSARNEAVNLGSAPLIAFIDADDLWDVNKLSYHVALHRDEPELAASYARIAFIADDAIGIDGAKTVSSLCPRAPRLIDVLGENPICTASNFVVQRSWFDAVGGFNVALSFAEDQDLVARIVRARGRVDGIDAVLTGYRFSPDGLSMDLEGMHAGWRLVATQFVAASELASLDALYCRYLARRVLRAGGHPSKARHYVMAGLRLDAGAFMLDRRRGLSTLLAAVVAQLLPRALRQRLFA